MGSASTGSRVTATPIVPALDGFRAYAIAGVVLIHVLLASGVVARTEGGLANTAIWGLLGNVIDAFFIISGFVLFLPIVARRGDFGGLGRFARGRAARLLPGYWLCLALALALVLIVPPVAAPGSPSALDVLVNLSALQMPVSMVEPVAIGFGIDGPLWMISVIVGFYFLLPVIARPYLRHPLLGLALAAAITVGWKELALHTALFESIAPVGAVPWAIRLTAIDQLPGWLFSFALGMTGAWAYLRARERWPAETLARRALQALPAALAAYIAFAYLYGKTGETVSGAITGSLARSDSLAALGSSLSRATLMAVIAIGPLWLRRPFANRIASRAAELSFGVYLVHFIVIVYAGRYLDLNTDGGARTLTLWLLVVVPASLLYAFGSSRLVERPARDWARRRERRGPAPGAAAAPGVFEPRVSAPKPKVPA